MQALMPGYLTPTGSNWTYSRYRIMYTIVIDLVSQKVNISEIAIDKFTKEYNYLTAKVKYGID